MDVLDFAFLGFFGSIYLITLYFLVGFFRHSEGTYEEKFQFLFANILCLMVMILYPIVINSGSVPIL